MDSSPLRKLPPELRNSIYEYTFATAIELGIDGPTSTKFPSSDTDMKAPKPQKDACIVGQKPATGVKVLTFKSLGLALTATCKQLRSESLPIFWAHSHLIFDLRDISFGLTAENPAQLAITNSGAAIRDWFEGPGRPALKAQHVTILLRAARIGAWGDILYGELTNGLRTYRLPFQELDLDVKLEVELGNQDRELYISVEMTKKDPGQVCKEFEERWKGRLEHEKRSIWREGEAVIMTAGGRVAAVQMREDLDQLLRILERYGWFN